MYQEMHLASDGKYHGVCGNGLEITVTFEQMSEYIAQACKDETYPGQAEAWASNPEMWASDPDLPRNPYNNWLKGGK